MSTSDADGTRRPDDSTDGTTRAPDPAATDTAGATAPGPDPADETAVHRPVPDETRVHEPVADETAVQAPVRDEPATDTGKHAAVRPSPIPPPPAPVRTSARSAAEQTSVTPAPVTPPATAAGTTTVLPATSPATSPAAPATASPASAPVTGATTVLPAPVPTGTPVAGTPATTAPSTTTPTATTEPDPALFPEPNAPRSTSVGTHVLGFLVGLVLAPLAAGVLLLGQSRILAAQLPAWDASVDVTGIVLVALGLLGLAWVALLAVWTPAAPITGGIVLTAAGVVALVAPELVQTQTLRVLDSQGWQTTVTQVTVAGTSGTLVVAGFLVLVSGLVAALAHRRGVKLGTFRERHR